MSGMRAALGAFLAGLLSTSVMVVSADASGIRSTAHDFSMIGQNGETCAACHTPHSSANTVVPWAPIRSGSFGWADATETSGGTRLPTNIRTWSGTTRVCLGCHDGTVDMRSFASGAMGGHIVGAAGELNGNHPVAIPYPFNGTRNTYNGITTGDMALKSGWIPVPRDVKLYQDPSVPAPYNRGIECASCHDPHGTGNDKLLRASMSHDGLCVRCHRK